MWRAAGSGESGRAHRPVTLVRRPTWEGIVPLKLFFNSRGIAKLDIALAEGKQLHDKRATEKSRDWNRQKQRLLRDLG